MKFNLQCQRCGRAYISFDQRPHRHSKFCSRMCQYPPLPSIEIRLLQNRRTNRNGCWLWTGAITRGGYGQLRRIRGEKPVYVHHLSAMRHLGLTPASGQWVLHRCDVKACFNPDHLYLGTRNDNTKDAVMRGHTAKGERNCGSKLTVDEIREIRRLRETGRTQQSLAEQFGITQGQVSVIVSKKQWAFVS